MFALVILIFLRWVDRIARLGRLGNTIDIVERAAATALDDRRRHPTLGGRRQRQPARARRGDLHPHHRLRAVDQHERPAALLLSTPT